MTMTPKEYEAVRAEQAKNREHMAFLRGKIEAICEGIRDDPAIIAEAERLAKVRGTDAASIMDETIAAARAKYIPATAEPTPGVEAPTNAAVSKFRALLK